MKATCLVIACCAVAAACSSGGGDSRKGGDAATNTGGSAGAQTDARVAAPCTGGETSSGAGGQSETGGAANSSGGGGGLGSGGAIGSAGAGGAGSGAGGAPGSPPDGGGTGPSDAGNISDKGLLDDAKLFGYIFGDGDYYTDAAPPADPTFFTGSGVVAQDVARLACDRGYLIDLGTAPVDCTKLPKLPGQGSGQFHIHGFRWPHGADLSKMTSQSELRAFFSGLLIGEGSRTGLVDDQYPNNPAGHYATGASCDAHVELVVEALKRAGFSTAHVSAKNNATCSGDTCREARIDASEFCKFSESYGYDFAVFTRIPGATMMGNAYVGPGRCP